MRMGYLAAAILAICIFPGFCFSEKAPNYSFMHEATTAPDVSFYDYIIVGGGTAGCPLAATLSQNYSVLLLERGGHPYGDPNITNLSSFGYSLSDLAPSSPSQRFISEDGVINARARVLGGGSCLNAGFYTRAPTSYGDELGWDRDMVRESYEWVEEKVAFKPPVKEWQSAVREGLLDAGVTPYNGFTYDHIFGTKVGGTIFDEQGVRHTAADLLEYANPSGINVLLRASVHKIMFQSRGDGRKPRANGVIFRDSTGKRHKAYLRSDPRNEVIVSAGALGSPQLLMLSGIGPRNELSALKIRMVLDQPWVGLGMADNPMNAIFVPSPIPVEVSLIQIVGITRSGTYIEAACGENFAGGVTTRDFGMFSPKIGQLSTVPPKDRTPEAIAKAVSAMSESQQEAFQGGFILEKVIGPVSTGNLSLRNKNVNDNPTVRFNYFQHPEDLSRCVAGLRTIETIIDSKPFTKFRYDNMPLSALLNLTASVPVNLLPRHMNVTTSLEQFCKDTVMTIWHYHGGCHVGRVVDNNYRVMGLHALRVIDGSTFTYSPGTNPQATVMMLGRYMGLKMLQARLASEVAEYSLHSP